MQKLVKSAALCLAAAGMVLSMPVQAAGGDKAEKLRRLDIMLMVTALRCRTSAFNFQPDFAAFEKAHLQELNAAAGELRRGLMGEYGAAGAVRQLDRISTGMANQYGQGHPWLDCAQLQSATRSLAAMRGPFVLEEAANQLLGEEGGGSQLALARR